MTLAALGVAGAAFAGPPAQKGGNAKKPAPTATPARIACAVETDNTVDVKTATAAKMYADYKGNRYFFCCNGCPEEFKANPAKFAKNAHIKTPTTTVPAKKS